jgi:hypothetical protein
MRQKPRTQKKKKNEEEKEKEKATRWQDLAARVWRASEQRQGMMWTKQSLPFTARKREREKTMFPESENLIS